MRFGAPLANLSPADFTQLNLVFQIGVPPQRIDFLTSISGVEWSEAWPTRLDGNVEGLTLPVLSAEMLVRNKRATARPQDLVDADLLERRRAKKKRS